MSAVPFPSHPTDRLPNQTIPPYSPSMSNTTQIPTPRKRKQLWNDPSSFVPSPLPVKRSIPLTIFFPKVMPYDDSLVMFSKMTQTDPSSHHLDIEQQQLTVEIDELRRRKLDAQQHYESTIKTIDRCLMMTRSLLIEKSQLEKKEAREKSMENRLRLGQFVTQRQGTSFVEQWVDGYDFLDKQRAQEQLARAKENLDRERRNLAKKKTCLQQQVITSTAANDITTLNSNSNSQDFYNSLSISSTKSKRTSKTSTSKTFTW